MKDEINCQREDEKQWRLVHECYGARCFASGWRKILSHNAFNIKMLFIKNLLAEIAHQGVEILKYFLSLLFVKSYGRFKTKSCRLQLAKLRH